MVKVHGKLSLNIIYKCVYVCVAMPVIDEKWIAEIKIASTFCFYFMKPEYRISISIDKTFSYVLEFLNCWCLLLFPLFEAIAMLKIFRDTPLWIKFFLI